MDIQDDVPEDEGVKEDGSPLSESSRKYIRWTKFGVRLLVGAGVSHIVYAIIESHVEEDNAFQKVTTFAGKMAIGMVVGDVVKGSVDKKIDEAVDWYVNNVHINERSEY